MNRKQLIETDAFRANATDGIRAQLLEPALLGRIGRPDDIADLVAFLASHDARSTGGSTP